MILLHLVPPIYKMELIQLDGYFLRTDKGKTANKTIFTEGCLADVLKQIKRKQIYLMLGHSDEKIGLLVACSLDKKGLRGGFVLNPDNSLFFKVITAIACHVFTGFSILYKIRQAREVKGIQHIERVEITNVGLMKAPNNSRCALSEKCYDKTLEILMAELKDLEGRDFLEIVAAEAVKKTRRKDYGI